MILNCPCTKQGQNTEVVTNEGNHSRGVGRFRLLQPALRKGGAAELPVPHSLRCQSWQVRRIEVLNPIRYISFKRNEVKSKTNLGYLAADEDRTQRQTVALMDVRYRITAVPVLQPGFEGTEEQIYKQAERRIAQGKCYFQPSLGIREFVAYFAPCKEAAEPIQDSMDAGLMVYDIFDLHDCEVRAKTKPMLSLFHAVMEHGVIQVPPFDSPEVLKGG